MVKCGPWKWYINQLPPLAGGVKGAGGGPTKIVTTNGCLLALSFSDWLFAVTQNSLKNSLLWHQSLHCDIIAVHVFDSVRKIFHNLNGVSMALFACTINNGNWAFLFITKWIFLFLYSTYFDFLIHKANT